MWSISQNGVAPWLLTCAYLMNRHVDRATELEQELGAAMSATAKQAETVGRLSRTNTQQAVLLSEGDAEHARMTSALAAEIARLQENTDATADATAK